MLQEQILNLEKENEALKDVVKENRAYKRKLEDEVQNFKLKQQKHETCCEIKNIFRLETDVLKAQIRELKTELSSKTQLLENEKLVKESLKAQIINMEAESEEKDAHLQCCFEKSALEEQLKQKLIALGSRLSALKEAKGILRNCLLDIHDLGHRTGEELQRSAILARSCVEDKLKANEQMHLIKEAYHECVRSHQKTESDLCETLEEKIEMLKNYFKRKLHRIEEDNKLIYRKLELRLEMEKSLKFQCLVLENKVLLLMQENNRMNKKENASAEALPTTNDELVSECMRNILDVDVGK